MNHLYRKTGISLLLMGLAGILFFWVTDPRWGPLSGVTLYDNPVDAFNQAVAGTLVGFGVCLALAGLGVGFLLSRS